MVREFLPTLRGENYPIAYKNPYWSVIVDCKDGANIYADYLRNWERSVACDVNTWNGSTTVGLASNSTNSTVNLTRDVYFPYDGFYRIEIRAPRRPSYGGYITLFDGVTQIEDLKSTWHTWEHYHYFQYASRWFTKGTHTLKVNLTKPAYVDSIFIYPIIRFEGNKNGTVHPRNKKLDVSKITWTMNAISELDTIEIDTALKPEYRTPNNDGGFIFEFTDSITLLAGPNRRNIEPIFGGYVLGPVPSDDKTSLTINGVSRLYDLQRQPVYHNFSIGTAPATDDTKTLPYISFSNVQDLVRYLSETAEYGINSAGIPMQFGFYKNLADPGQFGDIEVTGFRKDLDPGFGNPKPSLKLTPGNVPGLAECVLWQSSDPFDAVTSSIINIDYYRSGSGLRYPLLFDVQITMYRAGETVSDAKDYVVRFTGTDTRSNVIGSVKNTNKGTWPCINFNMKEMFDLYAPSSQYNVTKVSIVSTVTQEQVDHPRCSAVWFDNWYSYGVTDHSANMVSADVKNPFEELQNIYDKTGHITYVVPGLERKDDILVLKYQDDAVTDEVLSDGPNGNVFGVKSWNYDPIQQGICNQSNKTFDFNEDSSGTSYNEDRNSIIRYGPIQTHEFLDDVNTQADADKLTLKEIQDHSHESPAFSVDIQGSVLVEPLHWILCDIKEYNIRGMHKIQSMTQTITKSKDDNTSEFMGTIDLNQPGLRFLQNINRARRALGISERRINFDAYRQYGLSQLGRKSPGAFTNY